MKTENQHKRKALIASARYFPNFGGVENSIKYIAQECELEGYIVHIVTSNIVPDGIGRPKDLERISQNTTILRYSYYVFSKSSALFSYCNALHLLKKIGRKQSYDLIISRNHISTLLLKLAGYKNVTYILPGIMFYQMEVPDFRFRNGISVLRKHMARFYHHFLQGIAIRWADRNIVFSNNMVEQLRSAFGSDFNVCVSKPGVDSRIFFYDPDMYSYRERLGLPKDKKIILGVGRFVEAKGFDILISAIEYLPDDYFLVLVGDGPLLENYQLSIRVSGLSDKVRFVGSVEDTSMYYKAADCFAMSSLYEPFGQTILEAQASGKIIAAFSAQKTGVRTATEEFACKWGIIYADDVKPRAFAHTLIEAAETSRQDNDIGYKISESTHNEFSWRALIESSRF